MLTIDQIKTLEDLNWQLRNYLVLNAARLHGAEASRWYALSEKLQKALTELSGDNEVIGAFYLN